MSLILELPPDVEKALADEASRLRLPLQEYAIRLLTAGRLPDPRPRTGAEVVAYWQEEGLVGTRPEITDAPGHARALRQQAEKRKRS